MPDYFCGLLPPPLPYHAGWQNNIMFLDNQDTTRIFHEFLSGLPSQKEARACLWFALACLLLGPQIPSIYSGCEQEFSGALGMHQREDTGEWIGHDCHVREDMFENPACVWKFGAINRKSFEPYSQDHSTFVLIQQLAKIRSQNKLIQSGTRTVLCSRDNGLWCVLIHDSVGSDPLFIAMNPGTKPVSEEAYEIPNCYGEFCGVELLIATSGGVLRFTEGSIEIQLPPKTFVLGQLRIKLSMGTSQN